MSVIYNFFKQEDGMGTVELVILIAVLVGVALIFGRQIKEFVESSLLTIEWKVESGVDEFV